MSIIPDGRTDKYYNQKYLDRFDKEYIKGFDYVAQEVVNCFFANFDDIEDSHLAHIFNEELPENLKHTFKSPIEDAESFDVETYLDLFKEKLVEFIEDERDEMITSMIDHYSDEKYAEIRTEVDGVPYEED